LKREAIEHKNNLFKRYRDHIGLFRNLRNKHYFSVYPIRFIVFSTLLWIQNFVVKIIHKKKSMDFVFNCHRYFFVKKYGKQPLHPSENLIFSKMWNIRYLLIETCIFTQILFRLWMKNK